MFGQWRARRWACGPVVLAVVVAVGVPVRADTVVKVPNESGTYDASVLSGDFNGDGLTDLALAGATTWRFVPVAFSRGDGSFEVKHSGEDDREHWEFAHSAAAAGAQILTGDFDGDGRTDLALTGAPSWEVVPVALSNGDGTFKMTRTGAREFAAWAAEPGVTVTTGDFNEDRRTDVLLTPGPRSDWAGPVVALSNGDGSFAVRAERLDGYAELARQPGMRVTPGDFNADGLTDVALVPGRDSQARGVAVALSIGEGAFRLSDEPLEEFADLARQPGMRVASGDFDGDARTDVVLIPGTDSQSRSLPVALSRGDGTFRFAGQPMEEFADRAREPGVRVTAGDFNSDGRTDLALTGGSKWDSVPIAYANEGGRFDTTAEPLRDFAGWAQETGATVVSGDFDANGATDLVLTGVVGWTGVPVARAYIDEGFVVSNTAVADFPEYAAQPGPSINFPGMSHGNPAGLTAAAKSVTVNWYDRSDNERGFRVEKRTKLGLWTEVHRVFTRNVLGSGSGEQYTWVDTRTDISGQCYRVGAYNDFDIAFAREVCTVRPDSAVFPQNIPAVAKQWSGFTSVNDGTGRLHNTDAHDDVVHGVRDWGVNLVWADTSLWRFQAEGGPNLMKGQAVAIRVWGGGWLRHGHQTWGVNLVLDDEPHFEWYVLGAGNNPAGSPMAGDEMDRNGPMALWNKKAGKYLIHSSQTWGINLDWFSPSEPSPPPPPDPMPTGIKTYRVINCTWPEAHTLGIWVKDLTAGTSWTQVGSAPSNRTTYDGCGPTYHSGTPFSYNVPTSGHFYQLVAVDADPDYCSLAQPNPNIAFNCVRMDSTPFLGTTTSTLVATATVN